MGRREACPRFAIVGSIYRRRRFEGGLGKQLSRGRQLPPLFIFWVFLVCFRFWVRNWDLTSETCTNIQLNIFFLEKEIFYYNDLLYTVWILVDEPTFVLM